MQEEQLGYIFKSGDTLTSFLTMFDDIKKQLLSCGQDIIICSIDLICKSLCDSACHIDSAFNRMIADKNYLCAASLIRMQMDNALVGWAGLICEDDLLFLKKMLQDKGYSELKISWEKLKLYGITKEKVDNNGIKHGGNKIGTSFAYCTLDLIRPRAKELYKIGCRYVHPSAYLLQASWFTEQKNSLKYKAWNEIQPYQYEERDIVKDYLDTCSILLWVLKQYLTLKELNVQSINSGMVMDATSSVSQDFKEVLDILRHQ